MTLVNVVQNARYFGVTLRRFNHNRELSAPLREYVAELLAPFGDDIAVYSANSGTRRGRSLDQLDELAHLDLEAPLSKLEWILRAHSVRKHSFTLGDAQSNTVDAPGQFHAFEDMFAGSAL